MTVKHILEEKGRAVFTMPPTATLQEAARELAERRIGALILTHGDGKIAGILSERDIVRMIGRNGAGCLGQSVGEVMTLKVVTCGESTTLDQVLELMTNGRFRHIPVADGDRLVGLVSIGDVVKRRIENALREAEDMRSYIAAG